MNQNARILTDKIKEAKAKTFYAKAGDVVFVYNQDHGDVFLVKNSKGETFSIDKKHLIIIN